jgi:ElaA protein
MSCMQFCNCEILFAVEQNCVYPDMDDKDQASYHLMGWDNNKLTVYTRLVPPGVSYPNLPSIGRVVTAPSARRKGSGRELMNISINKVRQLFGNIPVKIGAQLYLKKFYESLGFIQTSDIYDEDGIDHIEMELSSDLS